jgi:hypothetical protein
MVRRSFIFGKEGAGSFSKVYRVRFLGYSAIHRPFSESSATIEKLSGAPRINPFLRIARNGLFAQWNQFSITDFHH